MCFYLIHTSRTISTSANDLSTNLYPSVFSPLINCSILLPTGAKDEN